MKILLINWKIGIDIYTLLFIKQGLLWWFRWLKKSASGTADLGTIPGSGRPPGKRNSYPLQYFIVWIILWTGKPGLLSPWGHKESDMIQQLNNKQYHFCCIPHISIFGIFVFICLQVIFESSLDFFTDMKIVEYHVASLYIFVIF